MKEDEDGDDGNNDSDFDLHFGLFKARLSRFSAE